MHHRNRRPINIKVVADICSRGAGNRHDRLQLGCHTFLHAQKAVPTMNQKPHVPTWLSGKGYSIIFCDGMVNRGHQGQPTMLQTKNSVSNRLVVVNDIELRFPSHEPVLHSLTKGVRLGETAGQLTKPFDAL